MSLEAKFISAAVGSLALLGLIYFGFHKIYAAGYAAGAAATQVAWDKDKAAIQALADQKLAQVTEEKVNAEKTVDDLEAQYSTDLSAARATSALLAQRLRELTAAPAATGGGAVQPDRPDESTASTPDDERLGQIDDALGATLAECAATRSAYKALIAEITAQGSLVEPR